MQPHHLKQPMNGSSFVPRFSSTMTLLDRFSQSHSTSGECNCPFCLWTTGKKWSNKQPKYSNAESQTEKYTAHASFFEHDPKLMTVAMLHNNRRIVRPCYFQWLQVVEMNLKAERKKQQILNRWAKQSAYTCLKLWSNFIIDQKDFLRKGKKVIQMLTRSGLVLSIEKWKSETKKSKGAQKILGRVVRTIQNLLIRKALHGWMIKVELAIARKQLLMKVADIWWGNLFQKYFSFWAEISRAELELRQAIASEGTPPPWIPPRHVYSLEINSTINNFVSEGIGKIGITLCGSNTTSEIVYLDFQSSQTAACTHSAFTHLGKISSIMLEDPAPEVLSFNRIDVYDETSGEMYLFLEMGKAAEIKSESLSGVFKASQIWRKKASASGKNNANLDNQAGHHKRKLFPANQPCIVGVPKPPLIVKKLSFEFETSLQLATKKKIFEKWLRNSVIDVKLLHTSSSTNQKAADFYVQYSNSDCDLIFPALLTIRSFCKAKSSRCMYVMFWISARKLTFLSLVALQKRRFQLYCLNLSFLWSRICSHHIRAQYIQFWQASFILMNYLRVRSTPIVLSRNQHAANVLMRGLKRFRSLMYYRKWMKWKTCLQCRILALLPRRKLECTMHLKRWCWAKLGFHRSQYVSVLSSAIYITATIKADAISRRIQRKYLLGIACVCLIQSHIRVHFKKKIRSKVLRLLHEREQHAFEELAKVTELKTLLEQCHSPASSAAYWRKHGTAQDPGDIKQVKMSWATMQSIVRKSSAPISKTSQDAPKSEREQCGKVFDRRAESKHMAAGTEDVDVTISSCNMETSESTHQINISENGDAHSTLSPFLRRIEEAQYRATEYRKQEYKNILMAQRYARGLRPIHLVQDIKFKPAPDVLREQFCYVSEEFDLPEIRSTFRQLRNHEAPLLLVKKATSLESMVFPSSSDTHGDIVRVPNPPATLNQKLAPTFMSLRSKRLNLKK
jgi:hypothetical protein